MATAAAIAGVTAGLRGGGFSVADSVGGELVGVDVDQIVFNIQTEAAIALVYCISNLRQNLRRARSALFVIAERTSYYRG